MQHMDGFVHMDQVMDMLDKSGTAVLTGDQLITYVMIVQIMVYHITEISHVVEDVQDVMMESVVHQMMDAGVGHQEKHIVQAQYLDV